MRGVFEVLMEKADGLPPAQVLKAVEQLVPPSEFELETYPRNPSVRRYEKTDPLRHDHFREGWMVGQERRQLVADRGR